MKPQNVRIVNRYYTPVKAGIEVALAQIFHYFDTRKSTITAYVSANTLSNANVLPLAETIDGVQVERYKTIAGAFLPTIPYEATDVLMLTNFTLMPHIIVFLTVAALQFMKKKHFKLVYFPCGGFTPNWHSFPRIQKTIKYTIHVLFGRILLNYSADRIIAISEWEKRQLVKNKINEKLVTVVPLAIEDYAFNSTKNAPISTAVKNIVDRHPGYILQVSRVHPIKNIETTIKALARMEHPIPYVIAGGVENAGYKEELQKLIQKNGLENMVIFAGKISTEDKYFLIDNSLCMVHMSYNEAFGLSVYEGMSRGKVCIAANNSALVEAVKNGVNGYLIGTTDDKTLAEKLTYLQQKSATSERKTIEAYNKTHMKAYTWKTTSQKIQNIMFNG